MIPLLGGIWKSEIHRKLNGGCQVPGGGNNAELFLWEQLELGKMEKALGTDGRDGCITT